MSTTVVTPDPSTMPLDELRALVSKQLSEEPAAVVEPVVTEPAKVDPPAATTTEPPAPKRFRREIDLGDGSGIQRFEGATLDELVDNLAEAQRNATKKIREQAAQIKAKEQPAKPPSAEERLANIEAQIAWNATTVEFISAHPDYENTVANGQRLVRYMAAQGIPKTLEGLTQAFNELSESGLLNGKNATTTTEAITERIAPAATGTVTESSSGLSARAGSLAARAAKVEINAEDVKKMDTKDLREATKRYFES